MQNEEIHPAVKCIADNIDAKVKPKSNKFPDLTDEQIDEIANYNTKQKNKKQAIWGVKVFRGSYLL